MKNSDLTSQIIGSAINVHKALGPGLLEKTYQECLFYELTQEGFKVQKEFPVPLVYHDVHLECGYRIDLLVENSIVLEIKSVDNLNDVHLAQVLTYLKLGRFQLGFLMNFNVKLFTNGLKRVVNNYDE